jgi:hypothetical protein
VTNFPADRFKRLAGEIEMIKMTPNIKPVLLSKSLTSVAAVEISGYLCAVSVPRDDLCSTLNFDVVLSALPRWLTSPLIKFEYKNGRRTAWSYFNWIGTPIHHVHLVATPTQIEFVKARIGKKIRIVGDEVVVSWVDFMGRQRVFCLQDEVMIKLMNEDPKSDMANSISEVVNKVKKSGSTACHSVFIKTIAEF